MSDIQIYDCSDIELAALEARLKASGFILTQKATEKNLLPMEYLLRVYSGDVASIVGQSDGQ